MNSKKTGRFFYFEKRKKEIATNLGITEVNAFKFEQKKNYNKFFHLSKLQEQWNQKQFGYPKIQ